MIQVTIPKKFNFFEGLNKKSRIFHILVFSKQLKINHQQKRHIGWNREAQRVINSKNFDFPNSDCT